MRKLKRVLVLAVAFCMVWSFAAYADQISREDVSSNHEESVLLPADVLYSRDEYRTVTRGDFLSAGALEILNGQDGSLTINIDTYAHFGVDRLFHTVFLDQWDEDEEDWNQVNRWDFVMTQEEADDGELNSFLTSFTVRGYEVGKYYRVRGLHGAEYNDEVEACATETDGVLLTDRN